MRCGKTAILPQYSYHQCEFQVEFIMVRFDHEKKKAQLLLKAHELLPILMEPENQDPE